MFKLNGYVFWLKMITYWKNILLFWINSAAILKKDFDSKPVYNKKVFENQNKVLWQWNYKVSRRNAYRRFYPYMFNSDHGWFSSEDRKNCYLQVLLKEYKYVD